MKTIINGINKEESFKPFELTLEFNTVKEYQAFNRAMNRYIEDEKNLDKTEDALLVKTFMKIKSLWEDKLIPPETTLMITYND